MFSHDKSGFKQLLLDFYKQIDTGSEIAKSAKINLNTKEIQNILYFGMGGSAISGDLLNDILIKDLNVPVKVIRGYISPKFCSKNRLPLELICRTLNLTLSVGTVPILRYILDISLFSTIVCVQEIIFPLINPESSG